MECELEVAGAGGMAGAKTDGLRGMEVQGDAATGEPS